MSAAKEDLYRHLSNGGTIPLLDGPSMDAFSALELAQALEHEVNRSGGAAMRKIQISLDYESASKLAAYLRRAARSGV